MVDFQLVMISSGSTRPKAKVLASGCLNEPAIPFIRQHTA